MNENRMKGKAKELQGKAMRGLGKATGSGRMRAKGSLRELEGKAQGAVGEIQDAGKARRSRKRDVVRVETTRTTTVKRKRR